MSEKPASEERKPSSQAEAGVWIGRILSMIAPGLLGLWLDDRYGTRYCAMTGFVLGAVYGVMQVKQLSQTVFGPGVSVGRKQKEEIQRSGGDPGPRPAEDRLPDPPDQGGPEG